MNLMRNGEPLVSERYCNDYVIIMHQRNYCQMRPTLAVVEKSIIIL